METLAPAPSTDRRAGSQAARWADEPGGPPDTVPEGGRPSGTMPLTATPPPPLAASTIPSATETALLPVLAGPLDTAPLAEPVRGPIASVRPPNAAPIKTPALPLPAMQKRPLSYEVYTPDDTLRGEAAIPVDDVADDARRRRIGMGVLGVALVIGTTLAAIGSCEDHPPAEHESVVPPPAGTESPPRPPTAIVPAVAATAEPATMAPAYTPTPPLDPPAKPPRRRPPQRPSTKH